MVLLDKFAFLKGPLIGKKADDETGGQASRMAWWHFRFTTGLMLFCAVLVTCEPLFVDEKKFNCLNGELDADDTKHGTQTMVQQCYLTGHTFFTAPKSSQFESKSMCICRYYLNILHQTYIYYGLINFPKSK